MWKTTALRQIPKGLATLLVFSIASCSVADKTCNSSDLEVLSAQAVGQAESMYAAQSALEAMQRGDTEAATVILESQVRQGLTILRATKPELVSGKTLSELEKKNIDDAIQSAETYTRKHNLQVQP